MALLSTIELLKAKAEQIKVIASELGPRSSIRNLNDEDNESSTFVMFYAEPYVWTPLDMEGQRIQHRLHEIFEHFQEVVRVLLSGRVNQVQECFLEATKSIRKFIVHERAESRKSSTEVERVHKSVDEILELVNAIEDESDLRTVIVPDTNALIYNPQIESWTFSEFTKFRIVVTPTVLQELDVLKVTGRNDELKQKAERVIRQLKEYQRRAPLHLGVPIRSGVSELVAIAVEPKMAESLPWFDGGNADDRLIASMFEVIRRYPRSPVVLITRDINAQHKANFAGIPYIEPPDPSATCVKN